MNTICPPTKNFINPFEAAAMLRRLVANLRGFAYRRRPDDEWTMEWVTDGIHTITGYESHRFFHNQSLSFAQLIHPEDKPRVEAHIAYALESRHRTTVTYRVTTAHRVPVAVTDRLVGIYDAHGGLIGVEGVVDFATPAEQRASDN